MADPIPLSAPDGTVYAWACGVCRNVAAPFVDMGRRGPESIADGAAESLDAARSCCQSCRTCHVARIDSDDGLCMFCAQSGRRAFEALGAIGFIFVVHRYALAVHDNIARPHGIVMDEEIAALCGVDVETVRRW
ncbi:MAG: hypothetical protein IT374_26520 [Polyangiaceae bacterium]|nr:hypothetical protein [Polyangiaceae bacterium]